MLIADLMENGIALSGGGALLQGLAERLSEETRMRVYVANDPLTCVACGAGWWSKAWIATPGCWPACSGVVPTIGFSAFLDFFTGN